MHVAILNARERGHVVGVYGCLSMLCIRAVTHCKLHTRAATSGLLHGDIVCECSTGALVVEAVLCTFCKAAVQGATDMSDSMTGMNLQ